MYSQDTYYVENYILEKSTIPKFLSTGRYRIEFIWSDTESGEPVDGFWIVARLY